MVSKVGQRSLVGRRLRSTAWSGPKLTLRWSGPELTWGVIVHLGVLAWLAQHARTVQGDVTDEASPARPRQGVTELGQGETPRQGVTAAASPERPRQGVTELAQGETPRPGAGPGETPRQGITEEAE